MAYNLRSRTITKSVEIPTDKLNFPHDLHKELAETKKNENFILSPFSVSTLLAMLQIGSGGATKQELQTALHLPMADEVIKNDYRQMLKLLNEASDNTKGLELHTANRIYIQEGFNINPEYKVTVQDSFFSSLVQVDFRDSVATATQINSWLEEVTKNKIKNIISPDSLSALTRMVLVNGIYFNGVWKNEFEVTDTKNMKFFVNNKQTVKVNMMFKSARFRYGKIENLHAQVLELPYKGHRISMLIYLPNEKTGLGQLSTMLQCTNIPAVLEEMTSSVEVHLFLPKFKVETTLHLAEPLIKLGLTKIFRSDADFSGITTDPELFVSSIVQKAFIKVNEKGTEAAAATTLELCNMAAFSEDPSPPPLEFKVDHPFLFQIIYKDTNTVLFSGSVTNPNV